MGEQDEAFFFQVLTGHDVCSAARKFDEYQNLGEVVTVGARFKSGLEK
jgi:hypothetical protein